MWVSMVKRKIGIYVFTNKQKERGISINSFDDKKYIGLRYIVSEIDKNKNDIGYASIKTINEFDIILISITSYYDLYNLIREFKNREIKATVIVGGAGLLNINMIKKYIDIAVFGRGEGLINEILGEKEFDNVWYKKKDGKLENKYKIGEAKELINFDGYKEKAVGCNKKCYFCQYSWINKATCIDQKYKSAINGQEDNFCSIDFTKERRGYILTALDGLTEKTRHIINKNIKNEDIENKIEEFYTKADKNCNVKLFNIFGYSWEKGVEKEELLNIFLRKDRDSNLNLNFYVCNTHFVPMPFTPMENEPVNIIDFRKDLFYNRLEFHGKSLKLMAFPYSTTFTEAISEAMVLRGNENDIKIFEDIFTTKKYKKLKIRDKYKIIKQFVPKKLYCEWENDINYLNININIESAKKEFKKRKRRSLKEHREN